MKFNKSQTLQQIAKLINTEFIGDAEFEITEIFISLILFLLIILFI